MTPETHALLGASSAERWLNCPPSAQLTADMPEKTSPYAEEGRIAHSVAELKVRNWLAPMPAKKLKKELELEEGALTAMFKSAGADEGQITAAWREIESCTDVYLDTVKEAFASAGECPYLALEQRVDFSRWVPGGFGTADCIIIGNGTLHVIDYKHGKGIAVDANDNPQLMLYALGALERYGYLYDVTTVRWSIVQPRNGGVSHAPETFKESLYNWAEDTVKPAADLADKGKGAYAVGDWCRFCKAKATCRARSDYNLSLEGFKSVAPALISNDELGNILQRSRDLAAWSKDLEAYALHALLTGEQIPGWKAVEGRAIRIWTDQEAAFKAATQAGIEEAVLYERKPVTLAALEKLLGKKQFEPLQPYITTPPGKPALAPETDKRQAIIARPTAEEDFAGEEA